MLAMSPFKIFICYFFISVCAVWAQSSIKFEHITSEKGLSQNDVNSVIQDDEGFMWFGTHDGLNKYDGFNFKVFRNEEGNPKSIVNNLIQCLQKDKDGNLWMINTNAGVSKFNIRDETFISFKHDKEDLTSAPTEINKAIFIDASNRLWVATNKGVSVLDINNEDKGFLHYTILGGDNKSFVVTRAIFQSSDEQIWIGTQNGLFKAFVNGKDNISFVNINSELKVSFTPKVHAFLEDRYGNFFVGTKGGIFKREKSDNNYKFISSVSVRDMEIDGQNNLWVGGSGGLQKLRYDSKNNNYEFEERFIYDFNKPLGINRNAIRVLYKDKQGVFWAGTKGGGVNKFSPEKNPFIVIKKNKGSDGLSYNNVRSVYQDSYGTIWVGTEDGNLNYSLNKDYYNLVFNKISGAWNTFSLKELTVNGKKYLYIGCQSGRAFSRILLKKGKKYEAADIETLNRPQRSVFAIESTQDNSLWVGTYSKGLFKYTFNADGSSKLSGYTPENNGLSSKIVRSLLEDKSGNLWIGTAKGLNLITKEDLGKEKPHIREFKYKVNDSTSISNNYILDLFQSKDGAIWVGTLGGGLNAFVGDPKVDGNFKRITTKDGLPNNIIKGIEEDDSGNLWISSNKGISRYTISNGNVLTFSTSDGLQGEEFLELSSFKNKEGYMFFGGTNGISIFKPSEIVEKGISASPLLTDFYLLNKKVIAKEEKNGRILLKEDLSYTKSIVLKPKENSFSLEFSSTNYLTTKKNRFQFKLEGFDANWQEVNAKKRFATYTNIAPGDYKFRLRTYSGVEGWSGEEKQLEIIIESPWWKTPIAFMTYAIILAGLLVAFRRFTIVRAEEKHQFQVGKLEKKQSEELQQMKLEFFTNISHEFRTPLTLLKGPLDLLEKNNDSWGGQERQKQYDLMKKNTNYLLRLVNQLLDFRRVEREKMALKISNLNLKLFVEETAGPFTFLATKKDIDFQIISNEKKHVIPFDPDALEKILNNLLFNAFKFTPQGKSIFLEIHEGSDYKSPKLLDKALRLDDFVVLQIKDTGKGISEDKLNHIFERYYTERDKNIQGAGIGLSFTKKLVELHNGFIDVTSIEGEGTTFSVLLPKHQKDIGNTKLIELENEVKTEQPIELAADILSLKTELKEELAKTRTHKKNKGSNVPKVMIVEDNVDIRDFVKNGIEDRYEIVEAADGEEGLALAKLEKPQVIISDIMMPVMDGFEMVSKLVEDEKVSHIPIIMLTAKSNKEVEKRALELGVVDFVRKPFDLEVLLLKVKNVIEKQKKIRNTYNDKISLEPKEIEVVSSDQRFLQQAMQIIEENMMNTEFSVEMLVGHMGMSRSNLYLKLKEITGLSSSEFIRSVRLKRAVQLLKKSDMSVKEIMYMTGFNTASYFSKCFKKQYGVVPSEYMKYLDQVKISEN